MEKQDLKFYIFESEEKSLIKLNNNNYVYSNWNNHNFINSLNWWLEKNHFQNDEIQKFNNDIDNGILIENALERFFNVNVIYKKFYEKNQRKCDQLEKKDIYINELYYNAKRFYERKETSIKA